MSVLTVYSRPGCGLCDDLLAELRALCADQPVRIEVQDVDADPVLRRRYGLDVPLLFAGDEELCRHRLDMAALQAWLRRVSPASRQGQPV